MQNNISEEMRTVLLKAVEFAISRNTWGISASDGYEYEVDLNDARNFLKEIGKDK